MKILHLIPSFGAGGAQKQLGLLAAAQVASGLEVYVLYREEGPNFDCIQRSGCVLVELKRKGNWNVLSVMEVSFLIREIRPDVVQTWMHSMDVLGGLACRLQRVPWICSERSGEGWYDDTTLRNRVRVWVGLTSSRIVANSASGVRYWLGRGASKERVECIPNIVLSGGCRSIAESSLDALMCPRFVAVGRLIKSKEFELLFRAFEEIASVWPAASLVVAGDGPLMGQLRGLAGELAIERRVMLLGAVRCVDDVLSSADVFVSLSRSEGMPNSVLEAAAAGVPMVLSDILPHRELFAPNECVYVPTDCDVGAVAKMLMSAAVCPGRFERADRARNSVKQYSPELIAERYLALYRSVL